MNKEELAAEWCDKKHKRNPEEWAAAYRGFIAGYDELLQNLQQTDCSKLLEILEQMSKEENEALGKAHFNDLYNRELHANQKYCLAIVMQMINERQSIA